MKKFFLSCIALGPLFAASAASAQEAGASPDAAGYGRAERPSFSLSLERVGGLAYARVTGDNSDASLSAFTVGVGGVALNPFAIPRLGFDYITSSGLTVGGAAGVSRLTGSVSDGDESESIGSVFVYTLTPRVGYQIALGERVHLTPRAGLTLMGGSVSIGESDDSSSIFALAVGADAPFAFRVTKSFNLLAGLGVDYTVAASTSTDSGSGSSDSDSVDGALLSVQGWLGMGGYF